MVELPEELGEVVKVDNAEQVVVTQDKGRVAMMEPVLRQVLGQVVVMVKIPAKILLNL